ncbi:protein kinase, putative [Trichomonas vaginalis G3]|uniref:Protein kinase, putative n=1 Tax=Trichomonas vaginalis (strain ATCC PRA-98 / G3) TaxID=412133 RepID=A2EGR4_TRIV3|nr:protein serine/threonine kinase protein [Trichomonas vaginalis G3]EAY08152.1 protein kinase, putative [Trichomonas vaginalis G3]KAI5548716.1 protein serine/threonine kinase protein [Trichomonas vaginalis G3]|eukprot:XP_001320375.1 protein kinase [Trichomonas vaginalis G3]
MPLAKYGAFEITKQPELTIYDAVRFLDQIGSALQYMHENGYVHRDIKPQNVLIFDTTFALCDFSVSAKLHDPNELLSGEIGTSFFMAPQVANQEQYKPKPADMWSLGVTTYVLIYGTYPYDLQKIYDTSGQDMVKNNISRIQPLGDLTFPDYPILPKDLKDILRGLLDKDPDKRMTAAELVNHPFIQNNKNNWSNIIQLMEESDVCVSNKM